MDFKEILDRLPYTKPFLFVDGISEISENGVTGFYKFKKEEAFYEGHFKEFPITPGVLLTECMAQIGVVCLGIFLTFEMHLQNFSIALTNTTIDFYKAVLPEETVTVISEKEYFRFNKLKCTISMKNENGEVVAKGTISGMLISNKNSHYEK